MSNVYRYLVSQEFAFSMLFLMVVIAQSCAPRPPYRAPVPPPPPTKVAPVTRAPLPYEREKKPLTQEAKIREQDLKTNAKLTPPAVMPPVASKPPQQEGVEPEPQILPAPVLEDDSSLITKITPSTPPARAASLRLVEEGKRLLDAQDFPRALNRLEKSIAIDSTNAYGYFYIAKAHFVMGRYMESLNFLDVAASRLSPEPFWLAEVYALRGENFHALGMEERAEQSYAKALTINAGNRTAAEAMSRFQLESQPAQR